MDLSDQKSIEFFAKTFMDSEDGLDVLINNAGVMATPEMKTTDGYEYQLGVNHLGHFTLTNMVLPKLLLSSGEEEENDDNSKEAAAAAAAARIVCVSSEAHRFGRLEKNDLFYEKAGSYNNWKSYGQSNWQTFYSRTSYKERLQNERKAGGLSRATRYTQARSTPNSGDTYTTPAKRPNGTRNSFSTSSRQSDEDAGARCRNVHLSRFRSKRRRVSRKVFRQLRRESIIERREERGRRQVVVAKKCRIDRTRFLLE